jgi:integrase
MKLKEALEQYLKVDHSQATRETYRKFLVRFVAAIGPERPLDLIQPEDIDAYVFDMRQQDTKYVDHPTRPAIAEPLSSATIYKNTKMLKSFFRWCVERGHLIASPAAHLKNSKPGRKLGQGKAATDEEVELLLAAARFKPRDLAIVRLLAQSGCRAGEAANVRIHDLDLPGYRALVNGKGDEWRWIFFDEETAEILRAWLRERPMTDHDRVFTSSRGEPLTAAAVSQVIRRLGKTARLERSLGSHSLRHRVGLKFARAHVAPRVTQAYLGHKDIVVTLSYYQDVDESDLFDAGKLLK